MRGLPAPLGAPLAFLYGAALVARHALEPRPVHPGIPVICIGNVTTGGTGKTPMTAWTVARLRDLGRRPAILTRGYGGDEPALLRLACPGTPVVEEGNRVEGARRARLEGADALVLDDGFQHTALARDLDIVLVDATDPWGGGHLLPWGLLREPPQALGRARAVVLTRSDQVPPSALDALRAEVRALAPRAILAEAVHAPEGGETLQGLRLFGVCGIGNPEAFRRTLAGLGTVAGFRAFRDHHPFDAGDVDAVNRAAADAGAQAVVCTEKDAVKLAGLPSAAAWKPLPVRMRIVKGETELVRAIGAIAGADARASAASS